jgi:tetratricopeptide (TPR) repeat protein
LKFKALFCFEKAEDRVGLTLVKAYLAEVSALECKATDLDKCFVKYSRACELFLEAGQILKAVECQKAMGKFSAAAGMYLYYLSFLFAGQSLSTHADIFSENGRHEEAAWLYFEAGEHEKAAYKKAAREYCEVGNHVKVLAACYHGGLYKNLIDYLEEWAVFLT